MRCLRCKAEIESTFRACPHCGDQVTDFTRRYTTELLDGKYEILERLGAGGMGQIYLARHKFLGSTRVIKVVHAAISESKDAHDRFTREARTATKVQHPNVATLHDFAELPDGAHYMVWEYIEGENLAQRLKTRGTLQPRQALRIIIQALHGLEALHRAGIVHRDISPENLMVTADDTVKIIDLGVAKVEDPSETAATRTGIFVGKLRYAAPEQLGFLGEGERIDARADLFAMGMVLYELLTGRPPFEAKSPHEYVILHTREPQLTETELPEQMPGGEAIEAALRKALARDRANRFQSAREFAATLEGIEKSLPDQRDMRTVATPLDGDETLRVTPARTSPDLLHRTTQRTEAPATPVAPAATPVASPATPVAPPATPVAETVRTDISAAVPPAPQRRSVAGLVVLALALVIGLGAVAGVIYFWPRSDRTNTTDTTNTTTTVTAQPAPSKVAETAVEVLAATTTTAAPVTTTTAEASPVLSAPPPTTTTVAAAPTPKPAAPVAEYVPPPQPAEEEAVEEFPAEEGDEEAPPPFIEGGRYAQNAEAVAYLRGEVAGTSAVAVAPTTFRQPLMRELRAIGIDVKPFGPVVVRFDGRYGVVRKTGRTVFRYRARRPGAEGLRGFVRALRDGF